MKSRLHFVVQAVLIAVVYFAAAEVALEFAIPPGYATAVWPSSGIALAALLLGWRSWPGVWAGAALANFTIQFADFLKLRHRDRLGDEARSRELAADHFLTKPVGLDAYVAAMRHIQHPARPA